jgi:hypothetical protein
VNWQSEFEEGGSEVFECRANLSGSEESRRGKEIGEELR